ncbi:hypothetical protein CFBP5507_07930 [Agrobacterium salinitolerans]|uniref:Uncharacterized protein n=1 Tax=Agrobacterium salinitolerans TaxID=1183413 RepID=A0A4Z1QX30_9HYPH|nr:hypothetical protein [Agrobacterium salinitolerans]UYZ06190.1 hypothetical protein CFBP5507_07930 [Agrobacterium salinitolerans]
MSELTEDRVREIVREEIEQYNKRLLDGFQPMFDLGTLLKPRISADPERQKEILQIAREARGAP